MIEHEVLLAGEWRGATGAPFEVVSPLTGELIGRCRRSTWNELDAALAAGAQASDELEALPAEIVADFLERFADALVAHVDELSDLAARETALPRAPRLADAELPAMADQLRQAAAATRQRSWCLPTLSPRERVASMLGPIPGVAVVIGPSNFPFRFNAVGGGDFAAAVATRHAVIAKAHPLHPGVSRRLAELGADAAAASGVPAATLQMVYDVEPSDGLRLVADGRVAATSFTGSRRAGLALKASADAAGRPIYLELASLNPVVVLPGAAATRGADVGGELAASVLNGMGQFCTCPSLLFALDGDADVLAEAIAAGISALPTHPMLSARIAADAERGVTALTDAGAEVVAARSAVVEGGVRPRLLAVSAAQFRRNAAGLQTEVFGPVTTLVRCGSIEELVGCLEVLEGQLAGAVYLDESAADTELYRRIEPVLRRRVGRLLTNKVPTGVLVVPAMNHGGPYPASGHPGFTAVGIPASLRRFGMLQCYDGVRDELLPAELQAANPLGIQRYVDGCWTDEAVAWG